MLRIKGSAEHSRWTCVDRPSRSADEQLHNKAPHRKCLRKKTTACVSLLVFFRIRRCTFPYSVEGDASTISQLPTTHYTNTCVKLTIVTHLSCSERIAIASLTYNNTILLLPRISKPPSARFRLSGLALRFRVPRAKPLQNKSTSDQRVPCSPLQISCCFCTVA